jgi:signal transduction histidine kinase
MDRYALVIGIGQYDGMQVLSKPASDAIAVEQVLKQAGWRVTCLSDRVTYETLEKALKTFLERQAAGQDALIYFTGHGFMVEESRYEQRGYLATSDCAVDYDGETIIAQRKALSFSYLNGLIRDARLSSLVVLLDCCHGGLFVEDGLVQRSFQASPDQNFCWIAACRSFQQAYARGSEPHSFFTGALLVALAEAVEVTVLSVLRYLNAAFKQLAMQEPIYIGAGKDIPLMHRMLTVAPPMVTEKNPYQGLQAFTPATKQFFFGRDREIQMLVQQVQRSGLVPVIGASGSGKSSIVRAGLGPRLEGLGWKVLEPMKPGADPIHELKRSFDPLFDRRRLAAIHQLIVTEGLAAILPYLPHQRHLLVIDQFEEIFTLVSDQVVQKRFIEMLLKIELNDRLAIVMTMRSDFIEDWLKYGDRADPSQLPIVWVTALKKKNPRDAIVKPAELNGYSFESGLLALILKDVAREKNCLPLLELTLTQLWERASKVEQQLKVEQFGVLGGVSGVLNHYATELYEKLDPAAQDWAKRIYLKLIRTGEEFRDTSQRQRKQDLIDLGTVAEQELLQTILEDLVDSRLVMTDVTGFWVELAHEGLIENWELLDQWRQDDRELRRLADKVEDCYQAWIESEKDDDFLLSRGLQKICNSRWNELQIHIGYSRKDFCIASNHKNAQLISTLEEREAQFAFQANMLSQQNQELKKQRKQIEDQNLRLLEVPKLKSEFLSNTSHELRTPLNAILGYSKLLVWKDHTLSPEQEDMVNQIFHSGQLLLELINDILDLAKIESKGLSLKPEQLRLNDLLAETIEGFRSQADQKHLCLNYQSHLDNPYIINDRRYLRQVIINLLSNAIKFTESGSVEIELREDGPDRIIVLVKDTGIGIAEEDVPKIFAGFQQLEQNQTQSQSGLGLGLAINRRLLQQMGGEISVISQVGEGSTFRVDLPRSIGDSSEPQTPIDRD